MSQRAIPTLADCQEEANRAAQASRPFITDDIERYPLPLIVPNDQALQNAPGCLPKDSLESGVATMGAPRIHGSQTAERPRYARSAGIPRCGERMLFGHLG